MDNFCMYMVTHKPVDKIPKDRVPLFVGTGDNKAGYLADSEGDNISSKNKNYCELTGIYWIWKNDKASEYVSIEHYGRFFMNRFIPKISRKKYIWNLLKSYDAVTSRQYIVNESVYKYYCEHHFESDLIEIRKIISRIYPEYIDAFDSFFSNDKSVMLNMVAMKKELFDSYCEWLFQILFLLEKEIDISNRDTYQQRVYGFLAERLFNVWLIKNDIKTVPLPIYHLENHALISLAKSIKHRK